MSVLIDRLVLRKYFYLAIRICQYLKLPDSEGASRILAHWACYKVSVIDCSFNNWVQLIYMNMHNETPAWSNLLKHFTIEAFVKVLK